MLHAPFLVFIYIYKPIDSNLIKNAANVYYIVCFIHEGKTNSHGIHMRGYGYL